MVEVVRLDQILNMFGKRADGVCWKTQCRVKEKEMDHDDSEVFGLTNWKPGVGIY